MGDIADLRKFIEDQAKVTNDKIDGLIMKINEKDQKILALEQRVLELERSKSLLERRIDDNESYGRKQNLRIFGIPNPKQGQKETEEECIKKVRVQIEKLNIENKDVNIKIDRAHRVGAQMKDKNGKLLDRPMIVRFTSWQARTAVYRSRNKNGNVRFYIDLTRRRYLLKKRAMELVAGNEKVAFAFADVNNNICLRLNDNSVKFFNSEYELNSILNDI